MSVTYTYHVHGPGAVRSHHGQYLLDRLRDISGIATRLGVRALSHVRRSKIKQPETVAFDSVYCLSQSETRL